MLYWSNNGQTQCDQLVPCADGGDFASCTTYPYAFYFFEAIVNFNNYLTKLDGAIQDCAGSVAFTQTQINEFYTPRKVRKFLSQATSLEPCL